MKNNKNPGEFSPGFSVIQKAKALNSNYVAKKITYRIDKMKKML